MLGINLIPRIIVETNFVGMCLRPTEVQSQRFQLFYLCVDGRFPKSSHKINASMHTYSVLLNIALNKQTLPFTTSIGQLQLNISKLV